LPRHRHRSPIAKCCQKNARRLSGVKVEISHNWHCRPLLRARRERPRGRRAAEQRDELAAL